MSEPPAKRKRDTMMHDDYQDWLKDQRAHALSSTGLSARIFRAGDNYIKEQILALVGGEWQSLQMYRDDVPGLDAVRKCILESRPITPAQKENATCLNTHVFKEEVDALQRASDASITPKLVQSFMVHLSDGFRLGITVQRKLLYMLTLPEP